MKYFLRHLLKLINKIKGGNPMEEENKPKRPSEWANQENAKQPAKKPLEEQKFDKNGNLFIKLSMDDSALVVRSNGSVELVSHDLENSDDGYVGDVEDLNKTFSLVLALASALENEDLYNRIFHNLNMTLMKKWDNMPDDLKAEITKKRQAKDDSRTEEEEKEKHDRIEEFRKRMNKYKETFLDDLDAEKDRLRKDMRDEADFQRRYNQEYRDAMEGWGNMMGDMDDNMEPGLPMDHLEAQRRPKMRKKKVNPLSGLRGVDWNPYDETLKSHGFDYRADEPPDDEEE